MIKCGFYEKEITPPLGCVIPGYYTPRIADGVVDKLYCRAMAVSNGEKTVVMMSVDAISVDRAVHDEMIKRLTAYTGIPESNVNISAIHTHTGPPRSGAKGDREYDEYLSRIGADCMILAVQAMDEATVKFGRGQVEDISFNRVYVMKDGHIQTAPEIGDPEVVRPHGPIDPEVAVLYAESPDGKPLGAIVNFACHPDVIKGTKYSADWPGVVCASLKERFGPDFVGIFVNGTCGNINHVDVINGKEYPPSSHYLTMGKKVAAEAIRAIGEALPVQGDKVDARKLWLKLPQRPWDMEKIRRAEHIVATVKPIEGLTVALGTGYPEQEALLTAKALLAGYNARQEFHTVGVSAIRIGDCWFYGLPSEMFVQFGLYVKAHSPGRNNIVAELSNGSKGYIPLKDLILDTVYESRRNSFPMEAGSGEKIAETAVALAQEMAD